MLVLSDILSKENVGGGGYVAPQGLDKDDKRESDGEASLGASEGRAEALPFQGQLVHLALPNSIHPLPGPLRSRSGSLHRVPSPICPQWFVLILSSSASLSSLATALMQLAPVAVLPYFISWLIYNPATYQVRLFLLAASPILILQPYNVTVGNSTVLVDPTTAWENSSFALAPAPTAIEGNAS